MQLLPNKVWIANFKDNKAEFLTSTFKEDSLKDHLCDSLKDMKT